MDNRIPKIIHYCWFGDKDQQGILPQECMRTWGNLDSYQIMKWDESNCDIHENAFVEKCYQNKNYAFVSDYFRLKALNEYGGIYLDTDVYVNKSFDDLLKHDFFAGFIYNHSIGTAVIGAAPRNVIIQQALRDYQDMDDCIVNNILFTKCVESFFPSLILNGKTQSFPEQNSIILNKNEFESGKIIGKPYCIHMCDGSWWRENWEDKERHNKKKLMLSKTPIINVLAIIKWFAAKKKNREFKKQGKN